MTIKKRIDQLGEHHLRDLSRLTPGTRVLFGHVPELTGDPAIIGYHEFYSGELATVKKIETISANELFKFKTPVSWAQHTSSVIFYTQEDGRDWKNFATDAGVERYTEGHYNSANFTVLLDDLEAAGIELILDVTQKYKRRLEKFNAEVVIEDDFEVDDEGRELYDYSE
jgi:hypothetical protein